MNTQHANSPCCQGKIIRFGGRRRQCIICARTWRVRLKHRGRKRIRANPDMVVRYLSQRGILSQLARPARLSRDQIQRRLARGLSVYLKSVPIITEVQAKQPLIAVADAMWHTSEGVDCTVYLILVRSLHSHRALILPPVVIPGTESWRGWQIAWEEVPNPIKSRIVALVCDGKQALRTIAETHNWLVQLCHFHLIASIKNYATGHRGTKWEMRGRILLGLVREIITTRDEEILTTRLADLQAIVAVLPHTLLRRRLRLLLNNWQTYRTYLMYPQLYLPNTTNSAESLIRIIRAQLGRSRGFRGTRSLIRWLRAICAFKNTIVCNGKYQPN